MGEQDIDLALVRRVQKGDKAAFNLLVRRYQQKLSSLVSRYVSTQADVGDVVQEAFIKAYRALPNFRGESAFYTWLYRIAVNSAKNYLTAQGRKPHTTDVDAEDAERHMIQAMEARENGNNRAYSDSESAQTQTTTFQAADHPTAGNDNMNNCSFRPGHVHELKEVYDQRAKRMEELARRLTQQKRRQSSLRLLQQEQ